MNIEKLRESIGTLKIITEVYVGEIAGIDLLEKEGLNELNDFLFNSSKNVCIASALERLIAQVLEDSYNWKYIEPCTGILAWYPCIIVEITQQMESNHMSDEYVENLLYKLFDEVGNELGIKIGLCPISWSFERGEMGFYEREGVYFYGHSSK